MRHLAASLCEGIDLLSPGGTGLTQIKEVMSRDVVTIEASRPVQDAAQLMAARGVGCLMVSIGNKAIGILTERDFVARVLTAGFDPTKMLVRDVMTTPIFTVSSDQPLEKAAELMVTYKVRRLPVVDEGVLVGIITASDLARALAAKVKEQELMLNAIARHAKPPEAGPYR